MKSDVYAFKIDDMTTFLVFKCIRVKSQSIIVNAMILVQKAYWVACQNFNNNPKQSL